MPTQERITELKIKYSDGIATDEEIRELFEALGESKEQINLLIDIERDKIDPEVIV